MFLQALLWMAASNGAAVAERAPAPQPGCLDARAVQEAARLAADQLLVRTQGGQYRLTLDSTCGSVEAPGALLARDGYVCGAANEFVQTASGQCPIRALERLSVSQYQRLQRASRAHLAEVSGLGEAFRGSSARCIDPTRIRAWSLEGESLIVQTSRIGSGGNRAYRVLLSGGCPEAAVRDVLSWRSATGQSRICGIAGEYAVFSSQHNEIVNVNRAFLSGRPPIADSRGCPIRAVEPIDPDSKRPLQRTHDGDLPITDIAQGAGVKLAGTR